MNILDRKKACNPHEFIIGMSGSGKSKIIKKEIKKVYDSTSDNIIIIDYYNEYTQNVLELAGETINFEEITINPMNIDFLNFQNENFIYDKSDFLMLVFQNILNRELLPLEKSQLDAAIRQAYNNKENPTLTDLKMYLTKSNKYLCNIIDELYKIPFISDKTSIKLNKRVTSLNLKNISNEYKNIAWLFCLELVYKEICHNHQKSIYTWVYFEEIFNSITNKSLSYFSYIYKRARSLGGILTTVSSLFSDIIDNDYLRSAFLNTTFVILLKLEKPDINLVQDIFEIDNKYIEHIANEKCTDGIIIRNGQVDFFK